MNRTIFKSFLGAALSFGIAAAAVAGPTPITSSDIFHGTTGILTFTSSGPLGIKSLNGVSAVGVVGGPSGNEIDIGEDITAHGGFRLDTVSLAYLFDGPEWGDVQEVALLTGTTKSGVTHTARLVNDYSSPDDRILSLFLDGSSTPTTGLILGATTATATSPGTVTLGDIFSSTWLSSLKFTAVNGVCGTGLCNNQSDYAIVQVTAVPEPGALAMFGLGLLGLAFALRRRSIR